MKGQVKVSEEDLLQKDNWNTYIRLVRSRYPISIIRFRSDNGFKFINFVANPTAVSTKEYHSYLRIECTLWQSAFPPFHSTSQQNQFVMAQYEGHRSQYIRKLTTSSRLTRDVSNQIVKGDEASGCGTISLR